MKPLISVVIPVYNASNFLPETLESVLNQTYSNLEVILINDCSTDNSLEIINACEDPRIRVFNNIENLGVAASVNSLVEKVTGEYIARLDADDICRPDRIAKQLAYMENHPDIDICFSWTDRFSGENTPEKIWKSDRSKNTHQEITKALTHSNCLSQPTAFMRKDVFKNFAFDTDLNAAEDYELWLRLRSAGIKFAKIKEPLVRYRVHNNSMTANSSKTKLMAKKTNFYAKAHAVKNIWQCYKKIDISLCTNVLVEYFRIKKIEIFSLK